MARKRRMPQGKKLQTTELDLWLALPTDVGSSTSFVDIAQCLSLQNRKFFRQGMQYAIADVELITAGGAQVQISRLPHHWVMANAWEKSYVVHRESQDQVLDTEPSIKSRYADFKVFMNQDHCDAGVDANLLPANYFTDAIAPTITSYDWDMSTLQLPNVTTVGQTEEYEFIALGEGADFTDPNPSLGLINGYALSRARPQTEDPNVPVSRGWMGMAFDDGDNLNEIRDDIQEQNDEPPYLVGDEGTVAEFYPGGSLQHNLPSLENVLAVRTGTSSVGRQMGQGFLASCGLLKVTQIVTDSPPEGYVNFLRITLAPGHYKGVAARKMQDVN